MMKNMIMAALGVGTLALMALTVRATSQPDSGHADGPIMEEIGQLSVPRAVHQATLLRTGEVLITGGCTGMCDSVHSSVEIYSPAARGFRSAAPMSEPRAGHIAVRLSDGRILVAGGWNGRGATASAEIYDPDTGAWTTVADMTGARMNPFTAPLPDGRILVGGGTLRARQPLASAEIFDPATATFSPTASTQVPRGMAVATTLADGRVLITGGYAAGQKLRSVEMFDPATETFRAAGNMAAPRDRHAAILLPDARVLIIGGQGPEPGERYTSTEIRDPETGRFTPGPALRWGRHKIADAVAMLPSGAVLVAGGWQQPEAWLPGTAEFAPVTVAGSMYGRHEFATATPLNSGDVLVLGGYMVRPVERSASAWLVRVPE
jgi:hypothetical protein